VVPPLVLIVSITSNTTSAGSSYFFAFLINVSAFVSNTTSPNESDGLSFE
jgi:hypothetical protein